MTEKNEFEPDEVASLSSKAKWLKEELNLLGQSIGSRSQVLQTYVAFLKSSEEVRYLRVGLYRQGGPCPSSCTYSLIGPLLTKAPYKTKH